MKTPQELWRAIHIYPRVRGVEGFDDLLRSVRRLLPTGDCRCREHFDAYIAANPPDTSSPEALFVWGWAFHNEVNRRLCKPIKTLANARGLTSDFDR